MGVLMRSQPSTKVVHLNRSCQAPLVSVLCTLPCSARSTSMATFYQFLVSFYHGYISGQNGGNARQRSQYWGPHGESVISYLCLHRRCSDEDRKVFLCHIRRNRVPTNSTDTQRLRFQATS